MTNTSKNLTPKRQLKSISTMGLFSKEEEKSNAEKFKDDVSNAVEDAKGVADDKAEAARDKLNSIGEKTADVIGKSSDQAKDNVMVGDKTDPTQSS